MLTGGVDPVLNHLYFNISTIRVMSDFSVMRFRNILEELHDNVSTSSDVSVSSIMSVVRVVRGLFYFTI